MREVVNRVVPPIMACLVVWHVATHGLPSLDSNLLAPTAGPRAVVTVTESSTATPNRDALLAQLQNDTAWGSSVYRAYEANHTAAASFTEAYPGDSLHIGTLTPEGKLARLLYSGPLPQTKQQVLDLWKQHGGK
ncbi:hypothetical protein C5Y96_10690 [Blastopirellula marina]|uniref:Uncharacterized protein n=1 Tax=Blastopirellula marina TaxID=124 RepID=A0A2S8FMV7_9BACT|nr:MULTISPECIES: hypothetical protein [Pirellulaceae]PQO33310.1 hypothetical protein C5Y96_10690 [Blastopirellula marina]RCS52399.1 hypothetical protein DTL36_10700 [Bremerella cremea]